MIRLPIVALCLGGLLFVAQSLAADDTVSADYEVRLTTVRPLIAEVTLRFPAESHGPARLVPSRKDTSPRISSPRCKSKSLRRLTGGGWIVPNDCRQVTWSAHLQPSNHAGLNAHKPSSFWNQKAGFWLIAEGASLLRLIGEIQVEQVRLSAILDDSRTIERTLRFPSVKEAPFYGVVGQAPGRRFIKDTLSLSVYGESPQLPDTCALEPDFLEIWAHWRETLLPLQWHDKVSHLDIVWMAPEDDAPSGVTASAGSTAILLQFSQNSRNAQAMARRHAALLLTGIHEIFHAVMGPQDWPEWAGESLASHFALRAAGRILDEDGRGFLQSRILRSSSQKTPLLEAQEAYGAGDAAQAFVFYSRGVRFWRAIETAMPDDGGQPNSLARLLRSSDGFAELDFRDPAAISAYFDPLTNDRAGVLVNRFIAGETASNAAPK